MNETAAPSRVGEPVEARDRRGAREVVDGDRERPGPAERPLPSPRSSSGPARTSTSSSASPVPTADEHRLRVRGPRRALARAAQDLRTRAESGGVRQAIRSSPAAGRLSSRPGRRGPGRRLRVAELASDGLEPGRRSAARGRARRRPRSSGSGSASAPQAACAVPPEAQFISRAAPVLVVEPQHVAELVRDHRGGRRAALGRRGGLADLGRSRIVARLTIPRTTG